jgi:hypothetical protein
MMGEHAFAVLNNLPKCEENIKINKSRISKSGIYKEGRNFINQLLSPIPENRYVSLFLFSSTVSLMFELKIYMSLLRRANLSSLLSHPIFWDSTVLKFEISWAGPVEV